MQHTTGVAVVATQLADSDRRALSQAWYSALHLAEHPSAAGRTQFTRALAAAHDNGSRHGGAGSDAPPVGAAEGTGGARQAGRASAARFDAAAVPERRAPKTELARCIERGLTRRLPRGGAAFAVRGAGGRVALIVRTDGARTRVVAVCVPPLRERVERALAHARFALAPYGVRAEVA